MRKTSKTELENLDKLENVGRDRIQFRTILARVISPSIPVGYGRFEFWHANSARAKISCFCKSNVFSVLRILSFRTIRPIYSYTGVR